MDSSQSTALGLHLFNMLFNTLTIEPKGQVGCTITIPDDIPNNPPLYIMESESMEYELFRPQGQITHMHQGSKVLVSCVDKQLSNLPISVMELTCVNGKQFRSNANQRLYRLIDVECVQPPSLSVWPTFVSCAGGQGRQHLIGYEYLPGRPGVIYTICFDNFSVETFYSTNSINGAAIAFAKQRDRTQFTSDGTGLQWWDFKLYKRENQKRKFDQWFGRDQQYVDTNQGSLKFLSRGHYAPNGDFIFPYERAATYLYMNVAPEFQDVNGINWVIVEKLARDLAKEFRNRLDIITGGYGVLQLQVPNTNTYRHVVLSSRRPVIRAPMYFFKVLYYRVQSAAIVFLTLNNPYAATIQPICSDVCELAGFQHSDFTNFTKGYTYCCTLADFRAYYHDLPEFLPNRVNLLRHPYFHVHDELK